jgi:hypothetical protein
VRNHVEAAPELLGPDYELWPHDSGPDVVKRETRVGNDGVARSQALAAALFDCDPGSAYDAYVLLHVIAHYLCELRRRVAYRFGTLVRELRAHVPRI